MVQNSTCYNCSEFFFHEDRVGFLYFDVTNYLQLIVTDTETLICGLFFFGIGISESIIS